MADAAHKQKHRRMMHVVLTFFFAAQIPITPFVFKRPFEIYLVWVSQWALVASHWAAFEAAHPPISEDP